MDLTATRIKRAGFNAYIAEYGIAIVGQSLNSRIQTALQEGAAVAVSLNENVASPPIVRKGVGFSIGLDKLVVLLVTPAMAPP